MICFFPTRRRLSTVPVLLAFFLFLLSAVSPALASGLIVEVELAEGVNETVPIGAHLLVRWENAPAGEEVEIMLRDDFGDLVTSVEAIADIEGVVAVPLWENTGVVGCDEGVVVDPGAYAFEDFDTATDLLVGRTFQVEGVDGEGNVMTAALVTFADYTDEFFQFSDESGCFRTTFAPTETVYLSLENPVMTVGLIRLFLIPPFEGEPEVGTVLEEVRSAYQEGPQKLARSSLNPIGVVGTAGCLCEVTGEEEVENEYMGVARPVLPSDAYSWQTGDRVVRGRLTTMGVIGIVVEPWDDKTTGPPCEEDAATE